MGIALPIAGAVASGVGGAIKGGKGTPAQMSTTTTTRDIAAASPQEQQLQSNAIQNYLRNQELAQQAEGRLGSAQGIQDLASQGYANILGGQAFNLSPQEQAGIEQARSALVNQGTADVNRLLDERLTQTLASAGGRGLRGQALGALQGQVIKSGNEQIGDIIRQAQTQAAQAALTLPQQRIAAQSGLIGQGLSFADQLRQNAIQNRNALSNPALLQSLQNARLSAAGQTQVTNTPKQGGGFGNALLGGITGGISGATSGINLLKGFRENSGLTPAVQSTARPSNQFSLGANYGQGGQQLPYQASSNPYDTSQYFKLPNYYAGNQ